MTWHRIGDKRLPEPIMRPAYVLADWISLVSHYSDVILSAMASQITGVSIVCLTVVQAQITENLKAPRHWPLWGESTDNCWIPLTKGQITRKMFPFDDVIMGNGLLYYRRQIIAWTNDDLWSTEPIKASLILCEHWFPQKRATMWGFNVFVMVILNNVLNKQFRYRRL